MFATDVCENVMQLEITAWLAMTSKNVFAEAVPEMAEEGKHGLRTQVNACSK